MQKKDIVNLALTFERETWKWKHKDSVELCDAMEFIDTFLIEAKSADESSLKMIYDRLLSTIGIIRFKHGFESVIINDNPELEGLKRIINDIPLNSNDIINQYSYVSSMYKNYTSSIRSMDFLKNRYLDVQGKEGLYLAVESLKSLITNDNYRKLLDDNQINEILLDCVKLNYGFVTIEKLELKYKELIKQIWQESLSDGIDNSGRFQILFSNISSDTLERQAELLINRPNQASCSMIGSDFIATYGSATRKIGFIYPSNSEILMFSAYDLVSNVFGEGAVNKEKGTLLATPEVIESIGKMRATQKGEDLYSSTCYNEVLVNAQPCGIVVLCLGEEDLNVDYYEAKTLAAKMNLPIYYVDTMQYKDELSENDKQYIAFHSLMSYLGITMEALIYQQLQEDTHYGLYELIDIYKEQLADVFLTLKRNGNFSKENMCQVIGNIVDKNDKRILDLMSIGANQQYQ